MKGLIEKIQLKWMFLSGITRFAILALPVALVTLAGIKHVGLPTYRSWQESRFESQAHRYYEMEEWTKAILSARQALLANPDNLPARRIMADLGERSGSEGAVEHRRQIARIAPTLEHLLEWAHTAEIFRQFDSMASALDKAAEKGAHDPAFHQTAMRLATRMGDEERFQYHLDRLLVLEPDDQLARLNREILRMVSSSAEERRLGHREVENMMWSIELRATALHALATHAFETGDQANAFLFATWLQDEPNLRFDDRILILNILRQNPGNGWRGFLRETQDTYGQNPLSAVVLAGWMIDHGFSREAVNWLETLLAREDPWPALRHPRARALDRLGEWNRLDEILREENWEQNEFLRLAFQARALEQLERPGGAANAWQQAQLLARGQGDALLSLARAADNWGWGQRAVEIYWRYLERNPPDSRVFNSLINIHLRQGDSEKILRLANKRLATNPEDPIAANASAMVRLLRDSDVENAAALAEVNSEAHPNSPMMTTTLALAHYRRGHSEKALESLESLGENSLRIGNIPLYHALFLQANGRIEEAWQILEYWEGVNLLPEEQTIRESLAQRINQVAALNLFPQVDR